MPSSAGLESPSVQSFHVLLEDVIALEQMKGRHPVAARCLVTPRVPRRLPNFHRSLVWNQRPFEKPSQTTLLVRTKRTRHRQKETMRQYRVCSDSKSKHIDVRSPNGAKPACSGGMTLDSMTNRSTDPQFIVKAISLRQRFTSTTHAVSYLPSLLPLSVEIAAQLHFSAPPSTSWRPDLEFSH